jgi:hypothetical protein
MKTPLWKAEDILLLSYYHKFRQLHQDSIENQVHKHLQWYMQVHLLTMYTIIRKLLENRGSNTILSRLTGIFMNTYLFLYKNKILCSKMCKSSMSV